MSGGYIKEGGLLEEDTTLCSAPPSVSVDSPCGAAIEAVVSNTAPADTVVEGN